MVNCCVPGCPTRASDLGVTFHNVPHDPLLFEQWSANIHLDQYGEQLRPSMRVCSVHFPESEFWISSKGVRFLKRYAVPTVFDMCTDTTDKCTENVQPKSKSKKGSQNDGITSKGRPIIAYINIKKEKNDNPSTESTNDARNPTMTLSDEISLAISCIKKEYQPCIPQKDARDATVTSSKKKSPVVSPVKSEIMSGPLKSHDINSGPLIPGSEVHRQNMFIVWGEQKFSVVLEKSNNSISNKRPAEDGDSEWKAKRVVRLSDSTTPRIFVKNAHPFTKAEETNKLAQPPSGISSLPAVESAHEKTGVISESAVIPAPSEPASPEEGSTLKKADVVSKTKEVTPVHSQVQKPRIICAECKGKKVLLQPNRIVNKYILFMCPTEECVYPLGEDHLHKFLFRIMPNNSLQKLTRCEAPTLEEILAMIASYKFEC